MAEIDFYKLAQPSLCQTHIFFMEEQTLDIEDALNKIDKIISKERKVRDRFQAAGNLGDWVARDGLRNLNQMLMQRQVAAERLHDSEAMINDMWKDYYSTVYTA